MTLFEDGKESRVGLEELDWLDAQVRKNVPDYKVEDADMSAEELPQRVLASYVRVAEDKMVAWLYLQAKPENEEYAVDEVIGILNGFHVTHGIDRDMIIAMVKKHVYEQEMEVAFGKEADPGRDGYFEYFFDQNLKKEPKILPDGSVDYTSMSQLANVYQNQLIIRYHSAQDGEPGYTVDGDQTEVTPCAELPKLQGKGFYMNEDGTEYYSEMDGKISIQEGKIEINQLHTINGDVDLIVGRVEFYGDIEITGNVANGVVIKAGRNVTIGGTVSGAEIYAGGDVLIKHGLQGANRAKIMAKGNVFADFIEYAAVRAGCNIEENFFLSSYLSADGMIKASGSKGSVIGGYAHGLCGIECTAAGTDVEVKTVLHVGYEKEAYNKYLLLCQKEKDAEKLIRTVSDKLSDIQYEIKFKSLPAYRMEQMNREVLELAEQNKEYTKMIQRIRTEKESLNRMLDQGRGAKLIVRDKIYRGCMVGAERAQISIDEDTGFKAFFYENGTVESRTL